MQNPWPSFSFHSLSWPHNYICSIVAVAKWGNNISCYFSCVTKGWVPANLEEQCPCAVPCLRVIFKLPKPYLDLAPGYSVHIMSWILRKWLKLFKHRHFSEVKHHRIRYFEVVSSGSTCEPNCVFLSPSYWESSSMQHTMVHCFT